MVYVFNTLIVPVNFDKTGSVVVSLRRISVEEARQLLYTNKWTSAVGHPGAATFLTRLLGVNIPMRRISVYMSSGDKGIHLFLKSRLPEGAILNEEEMTRLQFWLILSEVKGVNCT